jgi:hypothetical protein
LFCIYIKNHNSCLITLGQEIVTKGSMKVFKAALCFGGCLASIWLVPTGYQSEKKNYDVRHFQKYIVIIWEKTSFENYPKVDKA